MRNLRNIRCSTWRSPADHQSRQITAVAWDTSLQSQIICYGPSETDTLIELVRVKKGPKADEDTLITSWDAPSPNPELSCDKVLSLYYFGDSLTACLVLAGGDIVVVREDPLPGEDRIEIVGSIDAGITAAKWSPDEELLAITTKADTVVFMSRSFEGVTDATMTLEDLRDSNHVSVGWGKKETQFKGRGANALRDPTVPEKTDEGVLSPYDDGEVSISWRGDGAYVAISTIHTGIRRLIRVYSREGVLDSVSEPVDGMEGALTWRPAGNLIACVQRLPDRADVVFFERNGLRHGQFSLRFTSEELHNKRINLSWNTDSSVLAVIVADTVQLWTVGNYHWYLKQEFSTLSEAILPSCSLVWHPEKALLFMVPTQLELFGLLIEQSTDVVMVAEYVSTIIRSSSAPPNDHGAVAVIDGKNVKVTPFRSANVPPPMGLYEMSVTSSIVDVAFSSKASSIAVLHQDGIAFYNWQLSPTTSSPPTLIGSFTFDKIASETSGYQQICFGPNESLLTLSYTQDGKATLDGYGFDAENRRMVAKSIEPPSKLSPCMISASSLDDSTLPWAQDASGLLHSLVVVEYSLPDIRLPAFLAWIEVAKHGEHHIAFGLSGNGHLYANTRLLVKNCTSFLLTPAHLIFTTTTNLLKFVHMSSVEDLEVPQDDPERDERCRSIERGARLVTAMPTSLSLVLQMPRGNLETIWPRAMVIAGIRRLIEAKNYKKAFSHCRTQRVDMNILYDHQPKQFMANIALFIDQIKKVTYLDLFLSSLREEDVTQTMYKETRVSPKLDNETALQPNINALQNSNNQDVGSSKINRICDAFLEALRSRRETNLQNIITANVCKSPPALDDGLQVVAELMSLNESMAEKAIEHICFLADVNKLYDNALGLYNLDLALLVAQQSQKDPREYLPFLQSLQEMETLRRQFSIDDHLGRHDQALLSLHKMSEEDPAELESYVIKHSLYKSALTLYRYNSSRHSSIMALYASYLESNSKLYPAAVAYESLHRYDSATSCYQRAGPQYYREALFCASQQDPPLSGSALTILATALADSLYEAKDYASCAEIQATYLAMVDAAITTLCKGYHFSSALLLAAQHQRADLLVPDGAIDAGLGDALGSSTELLAECKAQLLAQVPRIRELRIKAQADPLAFYEGEHDETLPDDISVAASSRISTSASLFTRYTGRQSMGTAASNASRATSKNRRREERKRARGKKGSVYEEEYLVASVGRLIERVESVRADLDRLVVALVRRGMRERALAIENVLAEVIALCRNAAQEIYGPPPSPLVPADAGEGAYRPTGADAVLAESIEASGRPKIAPVIAPFERLSLLGS
ncbi:MAG: hypothetical protein M1818_006736 [Claussenomyces sp. TS43310]|nr:MAG: hypothetical protein M1818_006736 [Claussenomyces sp. TS43310]